MMIDPYTVRLAAGYPYGGPETWGARDCAGERRSDRPDEDAAPFSASATGALEASGQDAEDASTTASRLRNRAQALAFLLESLAEDRSALDAAGVRPLVDTLYGQALGLQARLENVLVAAALRRGGLTLQHRSIDLVQLMAELRLVVQPLLAARRQRLRVRADEAAGGGPGPAAAPAAAPLLVWADPLRLAQALLNLILHAGACAPPESAVDVTVEPIRPAAPGDHGEQVAAPAGQMRVTVAAGGPGLATGQKGVPSWPTDSSTWATGPRNRPAMARAIAPGGALALTVARAIVAAHGGRLAAEHRPGAATGYWFDLPCSSHGGAPS